MKIRPVRSLADSPRTATAAQPMPLVGDIPTVIWELRKNGMWLRCSVCRTPQGLRLEESINEDEPFYQLTVETTEALHALAEKVRQQDIEDGWIDAGG